MDPPQMAELECPACRGAHWVIENVGGYEERTYACPACGVASAGHRVLRESPWAFFLQPHPTDPMTTRDFAHWLALFRAQFPSHEWLQSVAVVWYPGEAGDEQGLALRAAAEIGTVGGYHLALSNDGPDDARPLVCVQGGEGDGEAHFWCGPRVELDRRSVPSGFDRAELERIRAVLAAHAPEIERVWRRFSAEATKARARWLPKLEAPA